MSLYVYAMLGARPRDPLGDGLLGESIRAVACGTVVAAVGEMTEPPAVSKATLRGHDAVVRRLARTVDALLPARFGTLVADEHALCERLEPAAADLREALARVAGREQMIVRVYADSAESTPPAAPTTPTTPAAPDDDDAPGTRYLAERARSARAAGEVRELAPLRPALARFVAAERVERHATPPLLASVYHLIARGAAAEYTTAVEEAAGAAGLRVTVSGPWAAYAFAPESLTFAAESRR